MVSVFERRPLTLVDDTCSVWHSWIVLRRAAFKTRPFFENTILALVRCVVLIVSAILASGPV